MGNSSSRAGNASSSSHGPVIVAEALEPLPRYSDLCCVLGGVNKSQHTLLKTSLGFAGGAGGKFSVKDVTRPGATLLKSESKSNRKRTITTLSTSQGHPVIRVEGTHECVAFRKGAIPMPRGVPANVADRSQSASAALRGRVESSGMSGSSQSVSRSARMDSPASTAATSADGPNSDLAFTARALDCTFFEWGIEMRSNLTQNAHHSSEPVSIWVQENIGMGTVDFTWEGRCVARVAATTGGSIVCNGEKFDVGKHGIAMVVAPGMDWVLVSTVCILLLIRQSEHDAGLSTRAGDLSLLSSLIDPDGERRRNSSSKSKTSESLSARSSGSRGLAGDSAMTISGSGSGSLHAAPRKYHAERIIEEEH